MKKNLFIVTAFLLILVVFFSACKKPEKCENLYRDNIIGQWKLLEVIVNVNYSQLVDTTDYSTEDIIFDFQENNKLVVTGNIPDVLFVFDDFQEGEHFYKYNVWDNCTPGDPPDFNLRIDTDIENYSCNALLDKEIMHIGTYKHIGGTIGDDGLLTGSDFYIYFFTFIKLN